jgi:hypothetical protein
VFCSAECHEAFKEKIHDAEPPVALEEKKHDKGMYVCMTGMWFACVI